MLFMEERREKIVDFVSNLFGIIGGVITILRFQSIVVFLFIVYRFHIFSLFEFFLHQSTKAIIGKRD
jgi:hypothetical protein